MKFCTIDYMFISTELAACIECPKRSILYRKLQIKYALLIFTKNKKHVPW